MFLKKIIWQNRKTFIQLCEFFRVKNKELKLEGMAVSMEGISCNLLMMWPLTTITANPCEATLGLAEAQAACVNHSQTAFWWSSQTFQLSTKTRGLIK